MNTLVFFIWTKDVTKAFLWNIIKRSFHLITKKHKAIIARRDETAFHTVAKERHNIFYTWTKAMYYLILPIINIPAPPSQDYPVAPLQPAIVGNNFVYGQAISMLALSLPQEKFTASLNTSGSLTFFYFDSNYDGSLTFLILIATMMDGPKW